MSPPPNDQPQEPASARPEDTSAFDGADDASPQADLGFLQPPGRPDSIGRLRHYEVLEVLGRGGFGIVFRAFDDVLQRVVAIKVLSPQLAATSPARKRFLREARAAAQVRHDNVVQIYAIEEQPLPYLVMEYIPGETLLARLNRTGPFESAEVMEIGRQTAEGLAAAHAAGLIHRDVKQGNILIEEGTRLRVKITDFGLARTADDASITQSGAVLGTPLFMSPEQAAGKKLDHRSDLFSLGSVLYTITAGRPPFRAENTLAILKRVAEDTPRPIPEIIPEVPAGLCRVIARLMAKLPEDRFQSAADLAAALTALEHGKVPPAAPGERRARPGRRRLVLALLLGALVVVPLAWSGRNVWLAVPPGGAAAEGPPDDQVDGDPPGQREAPTPPGSRRFALSFDSHGRVVLPLRYTWSHPLTMEAWFLIHQFHGDGHQNIITDGPEGGFHLGVSNATGALDCLIHTHDGPVEFGSSTPLKPGQRYHVAMVLTRDAVRLYQDGRRVASQKLHKPLRSSLPVLLANMSGDEEAGLDGQLFDVRFSKSVRYAKDFTPAPRLEGDAHTWAVYYCDEGRGTRIADASGNGRHGAIIGAKWIGVSPQGP